MSRMQAQTRTDTLFQSTPERTLTALPAGCTDIETDEEGNVLLLQPQKHRLYKYFALSGYDSVLTIGGKGIGEEGFNHPSKIVVPNRQKVFLLDFDNRRMVLLNTNLKVTQDLNFLTLQSALQNEDGVFLFPIAFTATPAGDLYLLNQEDLKVYKLNPEGDFELTFGGLDYGAGSLQTPSDLIATDRNQVLVTDTLAQTVTGFDLYGTYQFRYPIQPGFRWRGCTAWHEMLIFYGGTQLHFRSLLTHQSMTVQLPGSTPVTDIAVGKDFFYILRGNEVALYRIPR